MNFKLTTIFSKPTSKLEAVPSQTLVDLLATMIPFYVDVKLNFSLLAMLSDATFDIGLESMRPSTGSEYIVNGTAWCRFGGSTSFSFSLSMCTADVILFLDIMSNSCFRTDSKSPLAIWPYFIQQKVLARQLRMSNRSALSQILDWWFLVFVVFLVCNLPFTNRYGLVYVGYLRIVAEAKGVSATSLWIAWLPSLTCICADSPDANLFINIAFSFIFSCSASLINKMGCFLVR